MPMPTKVSAPNAYAPTLETGLPSASDRVLPHTAGSRDHGTMDGWEACRSSPWRFPVQTR